MSDSDIEPRPKRFRDRDLFALLVSVCVTAVCGGIAWIVITRL